MIDDRSAGKATIVTSQLPIEHWHRWIGDETIADAMLDRLMQHHHRIALAGESLRMTSPEPNTPEPELDQHFAATKTHSGTAQKSKPGSVARGSRRSAFAENAAIRIQGLLACRRAFRSSVDSRLYACSQSDASTT
ncbi:ATP-binding protein [Ralstonia sp. 21MJYT02-11]|uniref:ATP-binding protein n=1 Tax=Ralstonia soli TaxID=2953896 RepID=A0ABT1ADX7_9RALS|nr:ATP-binding protein [Ralstonia soli]